MEKAAKKTGEDESTVEKLLEQVPDILLLQRLRALFQVYCQTDMYTLDAQCATDGTWHGSCTSSMTLACKRHAIHHTHHCMHLITKHAHMMRSLHASAQPPAPCASTVSLHLNLKESACSPLPSIASACNACPNLFLGACMHARSLTSMCVHAGRRGWQHPSVMQPPKASQGAGQPCTRIGVHSRPCPRVAFM